MSLQIKNQKKFSQHLAPGQFWRSQDNSSLKEKDLGLSAGFIPMIIMLLIIMAVIIWLAYRRVSNSGA